MDINQVWEALNQGKDVILKDNANYKVYIETANREYHMNHFTLREDKVLSVRCISNYFGSLMDKSELKDLKVKED